jgi:hypothetical protein
MIKRLKLLVKEMREVAMLKATALSVVSESITRHHNRHKAIRQSKKLHKAILAGKAPRGRTV